MALRKRLLLFISVQAGCIGFTIAVCFILEKTVSEQFSVGVNYSFIGLAYSTLLFMFIYIKANIAYMLSGLAFVTFWFCMILLVILISVYLAVFDPLFSHQFSLVSDCNITGMKYISLHGNEQYSILYTTFIDSQSTQRLGLACVSDNTNSFLFATNIQPYKFLNFNQTYRAYSDEDDQDNEVQTYAFSQLKLPSWLCSSAPFDYSNLKRSHCFASFFSIDSQTSPSSITPQSPSIQFDNQLYVIALSTDDPLKQLVSFKIFIFLVLYPLTMMAPQFLMVFALLKLQLFSSAYGNLLECNQLQKNIDHLAQGEEEEEEDDEDDEEEEPEEDHSNNIKKTIKKLQDSRNTMPTTQPLAVQHNTLTNQEQITQLFDGQYQFQNRSRFFRSRTFDNSTEVAQQQDQKQSYLDQSHKHYRKSQTSKKQPFDLSLNQALSIYSNNDPHSNTSKIPNHSKTTHLSPPKFKTHSFQSRRSLNETGSVGMRSAPNHSISINFYHEDNHLYLEQYNIPRHNQLSLHDSNQILNNQSNNTIQNQSNNAISNNRNYSQVLDSSMNPERI